MKESTIVVLWMSGVSRAVVVVVPVEVGAPGLSQSDCKSAASSGGIWPLIAESQNNRLARSRRKATTSIEQLTLSYCNIAGVGSLLR